MMKETGAGINQRHNSVGAPRGNEPRPWSGSEEVFVGPRKKTTSVGPPTLEKSPLKTGLGEDLY